MEYLMYFSMFCCFNANSIVYETYTNNFPGILKGTVKRAKLNKCDILFQEYSDIRESTHLEIVTFDTHLQRSIIISIYNCTQCHFSEDYLFSSEEICDIES